MEHIDWNFVISTITGISTAALALFFIIQTNLLRHQIGLGYYPYLSPRFRWNENFFLLFIDNVGQGNAIDVNLKIYDIQDHFLGRVDRYVLKPGEDAHTGIQLQDNVRYRIVGKFRDTKGKIHKINKTYNFPPSAFATRREMFEEYERDYLLRLEEKNNHTETDAE